jgi:hypothetical protein
MIRSKECFKCQRYTCSNLAAQTTDTGYAAPASVSQANARYRLFRVTKEPPRLLILYRSQTHCRRTNQASVWSGQLGIPRARNSTQLFTARHPHSSLSRLPRFDARRQSRADAISMRGFRFIDDRIPTAQPPRHLSHAYSRSQVPDFR